MTTKPLRFAFACALALTPAVARALPAGHWQGDGQWTTGDGQTAPFTYDLTWAADHFQGSWTFEGHVVPFVTRLEQQGSFLKVYSGAELIGQGYCLGDQCHYSAVISNQGQVEETFTLQGNDMLVIGSKSFVDQKVIWSAKLSRVP